MILLTALLLYLGNIRSVAGVDVVGTYGCTVPACVFANNNLRFGTGTENSVNAQGLFVQPFYYSYITSAWYKLTFSNYPLDTAFGTGTSGSNWSGTTVVDLYSLPISGSYTDYSEFFVYSADSTKSVGYGVITATRNITVNNQQIMFQNRFSLGQYDNFVQITTSVRNIHTTPIQNMLIWVGTRDDFVGTTDVNIKTRGNLVNNQFVAVTTNSQSSHAIMITNPTEGVLFYSETTGVMTSYALCCAFSNAYNVNPLTLAPATPTGTDGSYAAVLPIGDLSVGMSSSIIWYYAAGSISSLNSVVQNVSIAQIAASSPIVSPTPSITVSITPSISSTASTTTSITPSITQSASISASTTVSMSPSTSMTSTVSISISPTVSMSPSPSMTPSNSISPTASISASNTASTTPSTSTSPSSTATISASSTTSITPTISPSPTTTISASTTVTTTSTSSISPTTSISASTTTSMTPTATISASTTISMTPSTSMSPSNSISPTASLSASSTTSISPTASISASPSTSMSPTPSVSSSPSISQSPSLTATPSPSDIVILQNRYIECYQNRAALLSAKESCMTEKEACINSKELYIDTSEYNIRVILGCLISALLLSLCINMYYCISCYRKRKQHKPKQNNNENVNIDKILTNNDTIVDNGVIVKNIDIDAEAF